MFHLIAAKSFSLHHIFLNSHETDHESYSKVHSTTSAEDEKRYLNAFPNEIIQAVEQQLPILEKALIEAGMTLTNGSERDSINEEEQLTSNVEFIQFGRDWAVVTYRVTIGRIATNVIMLNVAHRARRESRAVIQVGSFGQILQVVSSSGTYVYKRLYFKNKQQILGFGSDLMDWEMQANSNRIREVIKQCAFNKICAALKIGPQLSPVKSFDIVCFENAIQFAMEKCEPLSSTIKGFEDFSFRMLYCLRVLHTFNIIHKDIKPANMAYSPSLGNFVLLDFGVSEYVRENPGKKSQTYREGTLQFMSPEMKRLAPECSGLVDVYWNDVYALMKSVEVMEQNSLKERQREIQMIIVPETVFIEDELLPALWQTHINGHSLPTQLSKRKELKKKDMMQVLQYFPQCSHQQSTLPNYLQGFPVNVQFIIRSNSIACQLILHLLPFIKEKRVAALLNKLELKCLYKTMISGPKLIYSPTHVVMEGDKLVEVHQKILRQYESSPQDQENWMEQIAILLQIADRQLIIQDAQKQCIASLNRIAILQNKLTTRQGWTGYASWLAQLVMLKNQLPNNTKQLFKMPVGPNFKNLLIKCIMIKYHRGFYNVAAELCGYFRSIPITGSQTAKKREIVSTLELLLQQTDIRSEAWLVLARFVWVWMVNFNQLDYFLNRYAVLVDSLEKDALSELLCMMSCAYRRQNRYQLALECCKKSLVLRQSQEFVDMELLIQQKVNQIYLYGRIGDLQSAKQAYQQFLPTMTGLEDRIRLKQQMIVCLLHVQNTDQAREIFQRLYEDIHKFRRAILTYCDLMLCYLSLARNFRAWEQDGQCVDRLVNNILEVLDEVGNTSTDIIVLEPKVEMLLILVTLQFGCGRKEDAQRIFQRIETMVVVYAWQHLFKSVPREQSVLKCCQQLSKVSLQPSKINDFIRQSALSAFIYAVEVGRFYTLGEFHKIQSVCHKYDMRVVCDFIEERKEMAFYLRYLCVMLLESKSDQTCLYLLSRHESVSKIDEYLLEAHLLNNFGQFEKSRGLLQQITKQEDIYLRAEAHQKLSEVYKALHKPNQAKEHQSEALVFLRKRYARQPTNRNIWLSIGIGEMRLHNKKEALVWLEKVQRAPQGLSKQLVNIGLVTYGACLNQLGRCKKSHYYLKQLPSALLSNGSQAERLFYLAHNCFILKRRRQITKYSAGVLAVDSSLQYVNALMDFFKQKGQLQRFGMMATFLNDQEICMIAEQPEMKTNVKTLTKALTLAKRTYRFQVLFLKRIRNEPNQCNKQSRILPRILNFRRLIPRQK